MRLLVTGATGFVGRNLVLRATKQGDSVLAPVRDAAKLGRLLRADDVPPSLVRALPADPRLWPKPLPVDAAIHCAGALFERELADFMRTNVTWTMAALSRLPASCPAVILSSQSAGGPTPEGSLARTEADADEPVSFYGESKLRMERALRREWRGAPVAILRPPMILGPRDAAALQLFKAVGAPVRPKPGLKSKAFSFVGIEDLLDAITLALTHADRLGFKPRYVASRQVFTDRQLLASAAASAGKTGLTLPIPHPFVRALSAGVDVLPQAARALPSLTRDRAKEIFEARWVVDPGAFEEATGWSAKASLAAALGACHGYYLASGLL
jgi:nucleoside-diphosphate-sugar epimerase